MRRITADFHSGPRPRHWRTNASLRGIGMYRRLLFTFVGLPLLAVTALADDSTADLNDLLEALVAKQVFTRSEADGFRARWKARHETDAQVAEAPVAPPATPATSIVAT